MTYDSFYELLPSLVDKAVNYNIEYICQIDHTSLCSGITKNADEIRKVIIEALESILLLYAANDIENLGISLALL